MTARLFHLSSLVLLEMTMTQHRIGASKVDFQIAEDLKPHAAENCVGDIDNMDKDKNRRSIAACQMFRKWY